LLELFYGRKDGNRLGSPLHFGAVLLLEGIEILLEQEWAYVWFRATPKLRSLPTFRNNPLLGSGQSRRIASRKACLIRGG
jgi:hypothetical protein